MKHNRERFEQIRATGWNARHPVGAPVLVRDLDGQHYQTRTLTRAGMRNGRAVVRVEALPQTVTLDQLVAEHR